LAFESSLPSNNEISEDRFFSLLHLFKTRYTLRVDIV